MYCVVKRQFAWYVVDIDIIKTYILPQMSPFNYLDFLQENFKNPPGLVAFCSAYGLHCKLATIEKWFQRNSISSEWLPILLVLLELDRGQPVRLAKYMEKSDARR